MDLVVVGDVVVSGTPRRRLVENPGPGDSAFGLLVGSALTIGNLEVPLTEASTPVEKPVAMRASPAGAADLKGLGFDLVSLATNHACDYGVDGLRDTMAALDAAKVQHAGGGQTIEEAVAPRVVSAGGQTLAFFSFCSALPPSYNATSQRAGIGAIRVRQSFAYDGVFLEEQPGTPPFAHTAAYEPDVRLVEKRLYEAKQEGHLVTVALHWGVPWCYLPEAQGPLAEYQRPLAHRLIDAGADLIIGHHPHSLHPVEFYRQGLILYSTGNFVFDWCDGFGPDKLVEQVGGRPTVPFRPALLSGPWYESAVFRIGLGGGRPRLTMIPIQLDSENQPVVADPSRAVGILAGVARSSQAVDPLVRVDSSGRVHHESAS